MIISQNLKVSQARIYAGLSMRSLATKAGLNIGTISKLESKQQAVSPKTAKAVSDALEHNIDELFVINLEHKTNEPSEENTQCD